MTIRMPINWTLCEKCRGINPWRGCTSPTPWVAEKVRQWHRECSHLMMEDHRGDRDQDAQDNGV